MGGEGLAFFSEEEVFVFVFADEVFFDQGFERGGEAAFGDVEVFGEVDEAGVALGLVHFVDRHEVMGGGVGEFVFVEFFPDVHSQFLFPLNALRFVLANMYARTKISRTCALISKANFKGKRNWL